MTPFKLFPKMAGFHLGPASDRHWLEAWGQVAEARVFVPQVASLTVAESAVVPAAPGRSTMIPVSAK